MNKHAHIERAETAAAPLIRLENIRKTYVTGGTVSVEVLRGISLEIEAGEFVAIMGASGSGKSTLMNIIGCLDRATGGKYYFAGEDVSAFDRDALAWLRRKAFGFIFQSYNLITNATALENVEVPAIYAGEDALTRKDRAAQLLTRLGLAERLTYRPTQLSGGQQQRVSIARALMNGGEIILADEPTGALDTRSGAEVMALLKDLSRAGHTIILITHDREVAAHADRQIEIRDGLIVADTRSTTAQVQARAPITLEAEQSEGLWNFGDMREALHMALRALRANLFRTILTLLGIVIGVGSVVAMLAFGEGAKQRVLDQIGSMGTNLLLVRPGGPNQRGPSSGIATLVTADADALAALPNIEAVVPEISGTVTARIGNTDYSTQATATTPDLPQTRTWPVEFGAFFTADDERSYAAVAVLGRTVYETLYPDGSDPIGDYVLLNNIPFQVTGVMTSKGATGFGNDQDDVVFVPLSTGGLRLFGQRYLRAITVAVSDVSQIDATEQAMNDLLLARHGTEDFRIRNMQSIMDTVTSAQNTLTVLLGSVAAISLLVGGIGVMNIMLVSVTERTREIGIRMATGARTRNILQQFLTEAIVVSGIGGLIGVAGGIAAGLVVLAFGTPVIFTLPPIVLAFSCATITGLVFGFAPALKAAQLDPVVALAGE